MGGEGGEGWGRRRREGREGKNKGNERSNDDKDDKGNAITKRIHTMKTALRRKHYDVETRNKNSIRHYRTTSWHYGTTSMKNDTGSRFPGRRKESSSSDAEIDL